MPDRRLEMTTVVPEPRERLFARLLAPDELARWWGPHGFSTPEAVLDPVPGGRYRLTMQPPDGDAFHVTGEFREVDPPSRLSYTFRYEEPAPDDRETVVVLTLRAVDGGTEITLAQGPFATDERWALHRSGWTDSLERLAALAGRPTGSSRLGTEADVPDPRPHEQDVDPDDAQALSRATGGGDSDAPDAAGTTGTADSDTFVGRVAGQDVGYAGETGAERRAAQEEAD